VKRRRPYFVPAAATTRIAPAPEPTAIAAWKLSFPTQGLIEWAKRGGFDASRVLVVGPGREEVTCPPS
jgi:hypothetical protein